MRLEFHNRHLSITAFPAIELPMLTIIVGINGSGKTHLLQAIQSGAVHNSVAPVNQPGGQPAPPMPGMNTGPIRLLSNSTNNAVPMPVGNAGPIASTTYTSPAFQQQQAAPPLNLPHQSFNYMRTELLRTHVVAVEQALNRPLIGMLRPGEDAWRLGAEELAHRAGVPEKTVELKAIFEEAARSLENPQPVGIGIAASQMNNPGLVRPAAAIAKKLGIPILNVTEEHTKQFETWGTDQFHFDLATLFGRYRDRYLRNRLQRLEDEEKGTIDALDEAAFQRMFGRPPWESLSETFEAFGLPYVAAAPNLFDYSQITFRLLRADSGEEVYPMNLSSGERVLLQFAISSYQHDDGLTNIARPRLLLLDELDAPLHPEMVHRWLGAISEGLVASQAINCILTTHSPTTVALAPEDALYEMRDGHSGLTKISKQDALNKLTFGVPTLSIDYSGRRQVFAESDTDAAIYERVYALMKSELACARELNFLSTGMRTKDGGEINSGCVIVKNIVQSLRAAGNNGVYGIVDWDGEAVSTDRVKVIAEGVRDGIESVLLDPLLVCLLLMKLRRAPAGLEDIDRFVSANTLPADDLQRMVDAVQHAAFPSSTSDKMEVQFIGGAKTRVLREYLTVNDHDLEAALAKAFPSLNKWLNRGRGELVKGVVEEVLTEHRAFCPVELKDVFETIANAPG